MLEMQSKQSITHLVTSEELHCSLFQHVAKVLADFQLLNEATEYVDQIGLICGGTNFQPVHFDVPADPDEKERYLEAMNLPNAPAIILLDFGANCRLGVPTTLVPQVIQNEETMSNVGQLEVNEYSDDEEPKTKVQNITVFQSWYGFIFRGDFKHSGAPLLDKAYDIQTIWRKAYEYIKGHMLYPLWRNPKNNRSVFDNLCEIEQLNEITRLHVQILPKDFELKVRSDNVEVDTWVESKTKKL